MRDLRWTEYCLIVTGCLLPRAVAAFPKNFPTTIPLHFIITGDSGTGGKGQYSVANAIEKVCSQFGCQFAIDAGDNIYETGPSSSADTQFQEKFEKPYAKLGFPFLMALGNHDQSGLIPGSGVYPAKGGFEVEYSSRSEKWMMPDRYYSFAAPVVHAEDYKSRVASPVIEFFVIDTNPLAPQNKPQFDWYRPNQKYDSDQRTWLRNAIAASHAAWKIVVGHHPYRNNGKQGNAGEYFGVGLAKGETLKKMYEEEVCGKVDLLVTGHDHSLQWLEPYPRCGAKPQFIISGAAAKSNGAKVSDVARRSNRANWEVYGTLGFFWAEATSDHLKITAFTLDSLGQPIKSFEKEMKK